MQIRFGDRLRWLIRTAPRSLTSDVVVYNPFFISPFVWETAPASSILIKIRRSWRDPRCFFRSTQREGSKTSAFFIILSRFNRYETVVWAMLKQSAISRVVRCRSTLIAAKICSSSVMDERPERAALEVYISGTKARKCWEVSALMVESPYTPHISRCASVTFNPFRKKNNKMYRKCTFLSSIFNEYCALKILRNWINSSVRCQTFSNLSNSMRQFAVRATHATFFSERTPSSEKTAKLNNPIRFFHNNLDSFKSISVART